MTTPAPERSETPPAPQSAADSTEVRLRAACYAAAALMVIGAIGPWASVSVLGTTLSVNGFDRDGHLVVFFAVVVAGLLIAKRTGKPKVLALLAAAVSSLVLIYHYFDLTNSAAVTVGWGLWLALLASLAALGCLVALRRHVR